MADVKKNKFELIWQFRHLFIHPGIDREVASCSFEVKSLGDSKWTVGIKNERHKLIATLLMKSSSYSAITLRCNAFYLFVGEYTLPFSEANSVDHVFSDISNFGTPSLELKVHEDCSFFILKRKELLYCDSLTVCCQLIPLKIDFPKPIIYFTLSNSNRICKRFPLRVNNFSSLEEDRVYEIRNDNFFFTTHLLISIRKDLSIRLTLIDSSEKNLILLDNVLLMDVNGMAVKVWDKSVIIVKSSVVPLASMRSHLKDKNKFLSKDRLTLQLQISAISQREAAILGEVAGMTSAQNLDYVTEFFEQHLTEIAQSCTTEDVIQPNTPNSLNSDLQNFLSKRILTDFELRFRGNSIHAHKAVLCARSSVFKAMLSTDMKESASYKVHKDMDAATMQNLVNFMYSDNVPSLDWDSTVKLYVAAEKYDVPQLKQGCSKILSSNLSVGNVCSLLCLADKHSDKALKHAAHHFIFEHDDPVMDSREWKQLMKKDLKLAFEAMASLYQMKVKP